jgi:hypothetical protein
VTGTPAYPQAGTPPIANTTPHNPNPTGTVVHRSSVAATPKAQPIASVRNISKEYLGKAQQQFDSIMPSATTPGLPSTQTSLSPEQLMAELKSLVIWSQIMGLVILVPGWALMLTTGAGLHLGLVSIILALPLFKMGSIASDAWQEDDMQQYELHLRNGAEYSRGAMKYFYMAMLVNIVFVVWVGPGVILGFVLGFLGYLSFNWCREKFDLFSQIAVQALQNLHMERISVAGGIG